jgi:hypothetical protein
MEPYHYGESTEVNTSIGYFVMDDQYIFTLYSSMGWPFLDISEIVDKLYMDFFKFIETVYKRNGSLLKCQELMACFDTKEDLMNFINDPEIEGRVLMYNLNK